MPIHDLPYADGCTLPSVVTFLDILGFKEAATRACAEGHGDKFLRKLKTALRKAQAHVKSPRGSWAVKRFTDNLVIGFPLFDDGESELGRTFMSTGLYQFTLAQHGLFVRGGITIGDVYVGGDTVFGAALVDAHELESVHARDPRIILSPSAMTLVYQHLLYYADVRGTPQDYHLLVDADGHVFINYLLVPLDGRQPDSAYLSAIRKHKNNVLQNLTAHRHNPNVWRKYAWVAQYHNFVCKHLLKLKDTYLIGPDALQPYPVRLADFFRKLDGKLLRLDTNTIVAVFKPGSRVGPLHESNKRKPV